MQNQLLGIYIKINNNHNLELKDHRILEYFPIKTNNLKETNGIENIFTQSRVAKSIAEINHNV